MSLRLKTRVVGINVGFVGDQLVLSGIGSLDANHPGHKLLQQSIRFRISSIETAVQRAKNLGSP